MTKFTIQPDQTHGNILCKNGKECICPFQQAIPTQTQMGGFAIMRIPCSTSCALSDHVEYNTPSGLVSEYIMQCTGTQINLELETDNKIEAKIINL